MEPVFRLFIYFIKKKKKSCPSRQIPKQKPHLRPIQIAANSSCRDYFDGTRGSVFSKSLAHDFTFFPSQTQAEKTKAGSGDDGHGNPEIDRLRKEVQDTKEINKKLRELLQVIQQHSRLCFFFSFFFIPPLL